MSRPIHAPLTGAHTSPVLARALTGWKQGLATAMTRRRSRKALALLEDHMLNDIGISRFDAERELAKPLWDR